MLSCCCLIVFTCFRQLRCKTTCSRGFGRHPCRITLPLSSWLEILHKQRFVPDMLICEGMKRLWDKLLLSTARLCHAKPRRRKPRRRHPSHINWVTRWGFHRPLRNLQRSMTQRRIWMTCSRLIRLQIQLSAGVKVSYTFAKATYRRVGAPSRWTRPYHSLLRLPSSWGLRLPRGGVEMESSLLARGNSGRHQLSA